MNIPNFQSFSKVIRFLPYPFLVVVTDQNYLSPGSRLCMCFKVAHKATVAYKILPPWYYHFLETYMSSLSF